MVNLERRFDQYCVVADIGGTNARFCCVNLRNLSVDKVTVYLCEHFSSIASAWQHYLDEQQLENSDFGAIAIACPIISDTISMTNCHWKFSIESLKKELALSELYVMNDFTAIAMCLPLLQQSEIIQIGGGGIDKEKPMVVLGPGTGLGVAYLIQNDGEYIPIAGEGGHAEWPVQNEQEWFIYRFLGKKYNRVSLERILSGPGLENIYQALAALHKIDARSLTAAEIAGLALRQSCPIASAAVEQFFASLGSYAGNLALTLGTFGGVYLAGGIVPKLIDLIDRTPFRQRFIEKGRFQSYNEQIATMILTLSYPGLLGAALYLKQQMEHHHGIY